MSTGYEQDLNITVRIMAEDLATPVFQTLTGEVKELTASVSSMGQATQQITIPLQTTNKELETTVRQVRGATLPMRILGRDIMSIAFGVNLVARVLGMSIPAVQNFAAAMMVLGIAMRTVGIVQQLATWIGGFDVMVKIATASTWLWNVALSNTAFWMGIISGGAIVLTGLIAWASVVAAQPRGSRQFGGAIPETGMYMLHKGETVVPSSRTNYSNVVINLTTGPISSAVDVDDMLDKMALRMAVESRRRGV